MILVGDIGGTNTRLAIFNKDVLVVEQKFLSKDYSTLEEIVQKFLKTNPHKITKACLAIAGPIRNGKCQATNLPWIVESSSFVKLLGVSSVVLLNDLEAKAYGLRMLKKEELLLIQPGILQKGNQALIAAGTGLGEAGLYWNGKEHLPFPCEGGHTDFAPRNAMEVELLFYLQKKFGHVSYERIISGPGIPMLYQFFVEERKEKELPHVKEAMKKKSPSLVISEMAIKKQDPLCEQVIDLFLSLYGAETGNLALKMLSLGGIYIGGGIAPYLKEEMKTGSFLASLVDKGRFRSLLESIPVYIVLNDDASILGAAYFASAL